MINCFHFQPCFNFAFSFKLRRYAAGWLLRAERRAVDLLVRAVNAIIQTLYPAASLEVFGSFPTAAWQGGAG